MQASAILALARQRLSDTEAPYQHAQVTMLDDLTEGESEAAERALLLFDDSSSFCELAVTAAKSIYAIDEVIIRVETAALTLTSGGDPIPLVRKGADWLLAQSARSGRPSAFAIIDRTLRLWPTPAANDVGTLAIAVYRLPTDPITSAGQEPEIPARHHRYLADWIVYRRCQPKDGEIINPEMAGDALVAFERRFGPPRDADSSRRHLEQRRVTTPYGGI